MSRKSDKAALLEGIGARVRGLRVEAHLTVKELAQRADLSPRFVAQLEAGEGNISIARLAQVATALHRPVQELIPPSDDDASLHSPIWCLPRRCPAEGLQELRARLVGRTGVP